MNHALLLLMMIEHCSTSSNDAIIAPATAAAAAFNRLCSAWTPALPLLGNFPKISGIWESTWDLGNFPSNLGILAYPGNFVRYLQFQTYND